ncbi:plasmid pRiA4b ORF-3 family protein [Limihaloglobus sulfuriphilus]|nr:plasmid pRiA4b ORF-3 family protein [Limihaloglobus sulfuriphilus]
MDDKMKILLSRENREFLLKYEPSFASHELFRMVSIGVQIGQDYELYFTEKQLDEFLEQLAELANNEEDQEAKSTLYDIYDYLEESSGIYAEDDYSKYSSNTGSVFILKVFIVGSKRIWRKIAIREGQTLHDLHEIIFDAFDRYDDHMYSFYFPHSKIKFNPRKIYDSSDEYTHPYACEYEGPFKCEADNASKATIKSLNLRKGQVFFYLFDFGDSWWHEITVENANEPADNDKYPRIVEEKGPSPEQYPDFDEE